MRSHHIEYRQPAIQGNEILIQTWVADMKKVTSTRRFEFYRSRDRMLLADAATNWAFIRFETGTLCRIPAEVANSFEIVVTT